MADINWVTFCRRTDDPKLSYIEALLTDRGIPHRRAGWSRHAPILQVPKANESECWRLLAMPARKTFNLPVRHGVMLDEVPDDHACFARFAE